MELAGFLTNRGRVTRHPEGPPGDTVGNNEESEIVERYPENGAVGCRYVKRSRSFPSAIPSYPALCHLSSVRDSLPPSLVVILLQPFGRAGINIAAVVSLEGDGVRIG